MPETRQPKAGCGHVFLLNCSHEGLAADAILIAGDSGPATGVALKDAKAPLTKIYETNKANLGSEEQFWAVTQAFLQAAGEAQKDAKSVFKRAKPLLAIGCPHGEDIAGSWLEGTIGLLYDAADQYGVDVAFCLPEKTTFKVSQVLRQSLCPFAGGPHWMITEDLKQHAARLQYARDSDSLYIFFGAGVSFPSGLPSWGGLLAQLAETAGFDEDSRKHLAELGFLDQPTLIEERMVEAGKQLKPAVAACVKDGKYTPGHALLAAMHVPAATTNYDDLYEFAAKSAAMVPSGSGLEGIRKLPDKIIRLPWSSDEIASKPELGNRSVLKLHGCVHAPESIVLTRRDYMRYTDDRQALRGMLQETLAVKHMMICGFSMTDDNVQMIIDQVRKVTYTQDGESKCKMGTVMTLVENPLFTKLWDRDFHVVSFGKSWADNPAWKHDCFLDYVASQYWTQTNSSWLLQPRFADILTPSEIKIAAALQHLVKLREDPEVTSSAAWAKVETVLNSLGLPKANEAFGKL